MTGYTNITIRDLLEAWRPSPTERLLLLHNIGANPKFRSHNTMLVVSGDNEYYLVFPASWRGLSRNASFKAIAEESSKLGLTVERVKRLDVSVRRVLDNVDTTSAELLTIGLEDAFNSGYLFRIFKDV